MASSTDVIIVINSSERTEFVFPISVNFDSKISKNLPAEEK